MRLLSAAGRAPRLPFFISFFLMPELPEVETIARALRQGERGGQPILNRAILSAEVKWARSIAEPSAEEFCIRIAGQTIADVNRRGKFVVMPLSRDTLLVHLRMSGDLTTVSELESDNLHDRVLLHLEGGLRLAFTDARKFGRMWLTAQPQSVTGGLGPEPLDSGLTSSEFYQRLHSMHRQLKPLLLDQKFLSGLGNIYADEALNLAKLSPLLSASQVTEPQASDLLEAVRGVLQEGIRRNGASIDWVYRGGDFQNHFRVYQRTGQPCPRCGTPIERIVVGQRGTHYCPVCQPLPQVK